MTDEENEPQPPPNTRIDDALASLGDDQREKMRREIQRLQAQRWIAVLGAVVACLAFVLVHQAELLELLVRSPRIGLVVEDDFLRQNGRVIVRDQAANPPRNILQTSVGEAERWIDVPPGVYAVVIALGEREIFQRDLVLKRGDAVPILVPSRETGGIEVAVSLHPEQPLPDSPLDISVDASANGYLWIFERTRGGGLQLVYPPSQVPPGDFHAIRIDDTFHFPDAKRIRLSAGPMASEEQLLFVVTSRHSPQSALDVALRFNQVVLGKASEGRLDESWGAAWRG